MSCSEAVVLQKQLAEQLNFCNLTKRPVLIAGCDCAFTKDKKQIIAAIVVLKMDSFELIETAYAIAPVTFPYIPGLLSFREAPVCLAASKKLRTTPDCIIVDGQGLAHPRRLGLAAHLGLFWDVPTIGCAKSRLIGKYEEIGKEKGRWEYLKDKNEVIGIVLRTRSNVKPVFVSPGNRGSLDDSVRIVLDCSTKYRLPEPTRLAHQTVAKLKDFLPRNF